MASPTSNASESSGNALSVSEAAALLRVSERTIRRRCEAGKMAARRVATSSGPAWQIDPLALRTPADAAAIAADTPKEAGMQDTLLSADGAAKVRTGAAIAADTFTAHLLEENRRLWAALEAAQQSEAVTKAALRELLRAQPKQLSQGTGGRMGQNGTDTSARIAPQRARNGKAGTYGPKASEGAKIEAQGAKTGVSYGDIANELERLLSNGEN